MRLGMFVSLAFALMLSVWSTPSVAAVGSSHDMTTVVALQQPSGGAAPAAQPSGKVDVDINVNHGGTRWYANPMWIAIGALALILLIVVIVMAARGGGTTVIKE